MANEIGGTITATLPTVSVTTGPTWATMVNAYLTALRDAVQTRVRTAIGLTVDSDVAMGAFSLTNTGSVGLENKSAAFSTASRVYERSGNLWFNDASGNQIQLTIGGTLNAAALGGIVGDYGGVNPAKVTYTDSLSVYILTQDPGVPAKLDTGDIKLRAIATPTNAVTLKAFPSLGASYDLIMPSALPGAIGTDSAVKVNDTGNLSHTTDPSFNSVSTLSGDIGHGAKQVRVSPFSAFGAPVANLVVGSDATHVFLQSITGAVTCYLPLQIPVGDILQSVSVDIRHLSNDVTMKVYSVVADGTKTQRGSTQTSASGTADETLTVSALNFTLTSATSIVVEVVLGQVSENLYNASFTTTRNQ